MNISSKCEYGARAVVDLARRASQGPIPATQIAERQGIPEKFLVHILLQLKQAGVVQSVRGAHGGYLLARPAQQITLRDVVTAIEGPSLDPLPVKDSACPELKAAWVKVGRAIDDVLAGTTIQEISDRTGDSHMYYI
jgi:Rrf2 family transcriptional regulator, cysteine metabolism repressor